MKKENLKVGLKVAYIPTHARGDITHKHVELGIISSWNDRFVFVNYGKGTNQATLINMLTEIE